MKCPGIKIKSNSELEGQEKVIFNISANTYKSAQVDVYAPGCAVEIKYNYNVLVRRPRCLSISASLDAMEEPCSLCWYRHANNVLRKIRTTSELVHQSSGNDLQYISFWNDPKQLFSRCIVRWRTPPNIWLLGWRRFGKLWNCLSSMAETNPKVHVEKNFTC